MPHVNGQYYANINRKFSLQVENMNNLNYIFFANQCPFFPIMGQFYPNEAFEFIKHYDYLRKLALNINNILPDSFPLLKTSDRFNHLELTRRQAALLFFLSFFGCLPENTNSNLNSFYISKVLYSQNGPQFEFARAFLNYLTVIGKWIKENNIILEEKIIYMRQSVNKEVNNFENNNFINLCEVNFIQQGSLFEGNSTYCVDFSNKYIGGGTLTGGCVQEEILFASQPELLVAMLFMEVMDDNSAIGIFNTIQYSLFIGYGKNITFNGSNINNNININNIKRFRIIAMDADFKDKLLNDANIQIYQQIIKRDIYKAFAGFSLINCDNFNNENINNNNIIYYNKMNMNNNMNMMNNMNNNNNMNMMNNNNNNININNINLNNNNMMNNNINNNNININNKYMNNNMNNNININNINMNNMRMNNNFPMNNPNMNNMQNNNMNMNNNVNPIYINRNFTNNNNTFLNFNMDNNNNSNNSSFNNNNNMNNNMMFDKTIATGNWGCGIFNGIHELKFIEQWIAASFAGVRRLDYYTFGHNNMKKAIQYYQFFKNNKFITAANLYRMLIYNKLDVNNLIDNLVQYNFSIY